MQQLAGHLPLHITAGGLVRCLWPCLEHHLPTAWAQCSAHSSRQCRQAHSSAHDAASRTPCSQQQQQQVVTSVSPAASCTHNPPPGTSGHVRHHQQQQQSFWPSGLHCSTTSSRSRAHTGWGTASPTLLGTGHSSRHYSMATVQKDGGDGGGPTGGQGGGSDSSDSGSSSSSPVSPLEASSLLEEIRSDEQSSMTPSEVVAQLDRFIVGQPDAKRAVAVAFRNRWRRRRVPEDVQGEISPKNILMIGPTGCGKTEIARRLAKLSDAPFVKVEATKFTEVGYHGRDVDTIIRDLVEAAIVGLRGRLRAAAKAKIVAQVEEQLLRALAGAGAVEAALDTYRERLAAGDLEEAIVEIEVPAARSAPDMPTISFGAGGVLGFQGFDRFMQSMTGGRRERRRLPVSEARSLLEEGMVETLFPAELIAKEAVRITQEDGIVFIDEIDKIVQPSNTLRHGSDPSSEGVQRDLLPIIEGSLVTTKHGPVATDHILFICSGAFHSSKPSDMLAELQGRLPIRVELKGLSAADFERILTEPEYNMVKQQQMLLAAEGIQLTFTPAAIGEVARIAELLNQQVENIGARRLHTVLERLVEEVSFDAPERVEAAGGGEVEVVIDKGDVETKLGELLEKQDLSKFIL